MNEYIRPIIEKSLDNIKSNDYEKDGILYCARCNTPKRDVIDGYLVGIPCKCEKERDNAEKEAKRKEDSERRRKEAFSSSNSKRFGFTFANDDKRTPEITKQLKTYCDNFDTYRKNGNGLLLCSKTNGGGKTFFACAVANELIDRGYCVKVTDFMTMRDEMYERKKKDEYITDLRKYDLIVIDDFGTEHGTDFMNEVEYRIINDLTENFVPLVLTTNYTLEEMFEIADRDKKRIYDRVFGSCVPVKIEPPNGQSRRLDNCKQITADFAKLAI